MKHAIITGGSKGLGKALVNIFSTAGWNVKELSRSGKGDTHIAVDLSNPNNTITVADELFLSLNIEDTDQLLLINNAGVLNPIKKVAALDSQSILRNLSVNIMASVLIIHLMIRHFRNADIRKTIVNISSGAALRGYPGWSLYCTGKAGSENFIHSIAAEEQHEAHPFQVINFDPAVMDTDMQAEIRCAEIQHFPQKQRFIDYSKSGRLLDPRSVADKLFHLITENPDQTQLRYHVNDIK